KDIRLNLDGVIARSSLAPEDAVAVALAAAFAARSKPLVDAFKAAAQPAEGYAALTAATLMGMNNVWYPFVEMAGDEELKTMRAELRMNAYSTSGGVAKAKFEAYALSASIIGKCHFCVQSHYKLLKETGLTTQQLRDVGRIAAVVNAAAQVIAAESRVQEAALSA
ncbi:MAG: carboxymuconolactone decarboxylase family protein, partial [Casimicrobiaceae bacterium]